MEVRSAVRIAGGEGRIIYSALLSLTICFQIIITLHKSVCINHHPLKKYFSQAGLERFSIRIAIMLFEKVLLQRYFHFRKNAAHYQRCIH